MLTFLKEKVVESDGNSKTVSWTGISDFRTGREDGIVLLESLCAEEGTPHRSLVQTVFCKSNHCMQNGEDELGPFHFSRAVTCISQQRRNLAGHIPKTCSENITKPFQSATKRSSQF